MLRRISDQERYSVLVPVEYNKLCYLEVKNFKGFKTGGKLQLAPITLLFGENSSGKSAIIKALLLQKQSVLRPDRDFMNRNDPENGLVFGSFWDISNDHRLDNSLSFRLDVTTGNKWPSPLRGMGDTIQIGIEFLFSRVDYSDRLNSVNLYLNNTHFAELLNYTVEESVANVRVSKFTKDDKILRSLCDTLSTYSDDYIRFLGRERSRLSEEISEVESHIDPQADNPQLNTVVERREKEIANLDRFISLLNEAQENPKLFEKLLLEEVMNTAGVFDWAYHLDEYSWEYAKEKEQGAYYSWDFNKAYPDTTEDAYMLRSQGHPYTIPWWPLFNLGSHLELSIDYYKELLSNTVSIGPSRVSFGKELSAMGKVSKSVGRSGERLKEVLFHNNIIPEVNSMLAQLDTGHSVELDSRKDDSGEEIYYSLSVIDTKRDPQVKVSYDDVGFGISQIIPIITQSLISRGEVITIEQPELHIHPRLQADLGEVFHKSVKERNNQFIIETHSEHLLLRILKMVRQGKLNPEDVAIHYVSRGKDGSEIERLRVDEDGDFIDEWPGGFFPERLRELD